jgi:hypothetical protein
LIIGSPSEIQSPANPWAKAARRGRRRVFEKSPKLVFRSLPLEKPFSSFHDENRKRSGQAYQDAYKSVYVAPLEHGGFGAAIGLLPDASS